MQKRIDDFIKIAKERNADAQMYHLYQNLLGLCAEDDRKKLNTAWNEVANERDLAKWDEAFLEETINPSTERPVAAPQFTGGMHLGILAGGGAGQMNAGLAQHYHSTTAAQQQAQAQAINMQAQAANVRMNDYYDRLHRGAVGVEKPLSYFDQVKSAIGL